MCALVFVQVRLVRDTPVGQNNRNIYLHTERALTVNPRTAESCLALSASNIHVLETKTTGTLN